MYCVYKLVYICYERGGMQEIRETALCESAIEPFPTGIEDFVFRRESNMLLANMNYDC
jgi:hypothetical protein